MLARKSLHLRERELLRRRDSRQKLGQRKLRTAITKYKFSFLALDSCND